MIQQMELLGNRSLTMSRVNRLILDQQFYHYKL